MNNTTDTPTIDDADAERIALSSNQWSVDLQALDAMNWLYSNHREKWDEIIAKFDDFESVIERQFDLDPNWAWIDTEELGLAPDYMAWIIEAIEATDLVWWEDGEPWAEEEA